MQNSIVFLHFSPPQAIFFDIFARKLYFFNEISLKFLKFYLTFFSSTYFFFSKPKINKKNLKNTVPSASEISIYLHQKFQYTSIKNFNIPSGISIYLPFENFNISEFNNFNILPSEISICLHQISIYLHQKFQYTFIRNFNIPPPEISIYHNFNMLEFQYTCTEISVNLHQKFQYTSEISVWGLGGFAAENFPDNSPKISYLVFGGSAAEIYSRTQM